MIRTRLTLWNSAVFALALTFIGLAIYGLASSALYRSVDDDLIARATTMSPMGPPGGPGGPGPHGQGDHDFREQRSNQGPGEGGPRALFDDHGNPRTASGGNGPYFLRLRGGGPRRGFGGPMGFARLDASQVTDLDPVLAERMEFTFRIGRPRFFFVGESIADIDREEPLDKEAMAQAMVGAKGLTIRNVDGHRIRIYTTPIRSNGKVTGALQTAASLDEADALLSRLRWVLLALLPLALLVTAGLGVWLTNRSLRPVLEISAAAERMEVSNLSGRLPVYGRDEFAVLSTRFNSMLERIEGSFRSLGEAYEAQRRFVADASHELKTPLTTVKGRVGLALRSTQTPERYAEHMKAIGRAANSMAGIIQDLLLLARSDEAKLSLRRETFPVVEIAEDAIGALGQTRPIAFEVPAGLKVSVDQGLMTRAITNLLSNAVRHTPTDKNITIRAASTENGVRIEVVDEGEGIPPEHLPRMFERFHRVDSSRDRTSGGTGLGLSIVRSIVESHGGTVSIESVQCHGTTVTILLPNP